MGDKADEAFRLIAGIVFTLVNGDHYNDAVQRMVVCYLESQGLREILQSFIPGESRGAEPGR